MTLDPLGRLAEMEVRISMLEREVSLLRSSRTVDVAALIIISMIALWTVVKS